MTMTTNITKFCARAAATTICAAWTLNRHTLSICNIKEWGGQWPMQRRFFCSCSVLLAPTRTLVTPG